MKVFSTNFILLLAVLAGLLLQCEPTVETVEVEKIVTKTVTKEVPKIVVKEVPKIVVKEVPKIVVKEVPRKATYPIEIDALAFDFSGEFAESDGPDKNGNDKYGEQPYVTFTDNGSDNAGAEYELQSAFQRFSDNYATITPNLEGFQSHTVAAKAGKEQKVILNKLYPYYFMNGNNRNYLFFFRVIKRDSTKKIVAVSKQDYIRLYWGNIFTIWTPELRRIEKRPVFIITQPSQKFHAMSPTPANNTSVDITKDPLTGEITDYDYNTFAKQNLYWNWALGYNLAAFEAMDLREDKNTAGEVSHLLKKTGRLLMQSDVPLGLKYFTIVTQQFSAVSGGLEFIPGRTYYFYNTGDSTAKKELYKDNRIFPDTTDNNYVKVGRYCTDEVTWKDPDDPTNLDGSEKLKSRLKRDDLGAIVKPNECLSDDQTEYLIGDGKYGKEPYKDKTVKTSYPKDEKYTKFKRDWISSLRPNVVGTPYNFTIHNFRSKLLVRTDPPAGMFP